MDACPDKPEDFDGNADRDGCPEDQDTDGDGILDSVDRCPKEREDFDGVEDADGCPDLTRDRDGDGFLDEVDNRGPSEDRMVSKTKMAVLMRIMTATEF